MKTTEMMIRAGVPTLSERIERMFPDSVLMDEVLVPSSGGSLAHRPRWQYLGLIVTSFGVAVVSDNRDHTIADDLDLAGVIPADWPVAISEDGWSVATVWTEHVMRRREVAPCRVSITQRINLRPALWMLDEHPSPYTGVACPPRYWDLYRAA